MAAAVDGDRFIEMVSAGSLYLSGEWERKYWSCSRGKDRYPYPVGYQAVRHFSGISYTMEIQQGPRGPVFKVTSTQGDSSTGPTPDIAWKNFQKKTAPKVRDWQRNRSFPQKIDGLFGFKNASVQRLLRELIVRSTGAVELNLSHPVTSDADSPFTRKVEAAVSDGYEDLPVSLNKTDGSSKRSMRPSQEERTAKRVHYQDISTSADKCNNVLDIAADEGSNKDATGSRCMSSLLEERPCNSKHTLVDENRGESVADSPEQVGLSSSSYLSSQKSDLDPSEREVVMSMMSILLPQAIPLLEKTRRKKKVKHKKNEEYTILTRTASTENPSAAGCQGAAVSTSVCEGTDIITSQTYSHEKSLCEMVKHCCDNGDRMSDGPAFKADGMNAVVADSFEGDEQVLCDNTSKSMGADHHNYDDACSKESYDHSRLPYDSKEDHDGRSECQMRIDDGTNTPDVIYDNEKGQYVLSEALLACLEEEFGEKDNSYPANHNETNVGRTEDKQHFEDSRSGITDDSSISVDVSDKSNFRSGLIDGYAQASAKSRTGVSRDEESLINFLQSPVHSNNAHNNNQKMAGKFDDTEFVDKYVAFESLGCPVDVGTKTSESNHPLGRQNECQFGCRNLNENTVVSIGCGSNICGHVPPKDEHALPEINRLNGPLCRHKETSPRSSNLHLDHMGCYLHPMPVLSIILKTQNNSSLLIYVLCGLLESCERFLYVYNVIPMDQKETAPNFVGYTPLLLSSLERSCLRNLSFERSGLQFTPNGQFLVLLGSYVSLLTKLMAYGTLSCILICEPNYIVTVENGRQLHIWMMAAGWRIISEEHVIPSFSNGGHSILELRRMPKSSTLIIGHDGAGRFFLWDISKRTVLTTFTAPGIIVFQILPEDIILASVTDMERRLQEITVTGVFRKADKDSILSPGKDTAIWILISSASVADYQSDLRAKEHNPRWRLALLANETVFMGSILDPRATAVDVCGNHGFTGTHGGLLYAWELSSGRKLAAAQCFNRGRVSCVAVDAKSGVVAVADDGCQLLLCSQNKVLSNARAEGNMCRRK
uniref:FYR C-terminal domain-containing protein n=1 Tax=Leersia perrieri TaxID=77586 RepID=A0A0D9XBG3_9ORYZ